jgi:16S rRNA (guanine(966)-N(2))-methyltransferase RsmD
LAFPFQTVDNRGILHDNINTAFAEPYLEGITHMRVTTGTARGRNLIAPPDSNITRPTSDMTKQAIFNIIQFEVEGTEVLDLFAGSGQLGIEALSRGARRATFIDSSREAQQIIIQNLKTTQLSNQAKVLTADAFTFLTRTRDTYDIAFLDPPYEKGLLEKTLPLTAQRMNPGGVILCETAKEEMLPEEAGDFRKQKEYRYGRAKLTVYRFHNPEENRM